MFYRSIFILFSIVLNSVYAQNIELSKQDSIKLNSFIKTIDIQYLSNPDSAIETCHQLIDFGTKINNKNAISEGYGYLAYIFTEKMMIEKSIEYWNKCLDIKEELKDTAGISTVLNNLGYIYQNYGDIEKAMEFFRESYQLKKAIGNKLGEAQALVNIGVYYDDNLMKDTALTYYFEALKIVEEEQDYFVMAVCYNNIGSIYDYWKKVDTAVYFYRKSLEIERLIQNKPGEITPLVNIGEILFEKGQVDSAEAYGVKAYNIAVDLGYPENLKFASNFLYEVYKKQEKNEQALRMLEISRAMQDSIYNDENKRTVIRHQLKYEFEKEQLLNEQKLKEVKRVEEEERKRRNLLQYSGIFIFVLLLFTFMLMSGKLHFSERMAEGLIFFTFVLFFEFILVLIDPYIESITNGEPVYKLATNAVLAVVIFIMHSYFENSIKERIVKK